LALLCPNTAHGILEFGRIAVAFTTMGGVLLPLFGLETLRRFKQTDIFSR
jgi:hypothetical protein